MTREEAINVIKGARKYLTVGNPIWNVKKVDEAFDMAIEALSAEVVHKPDYSYEADMVRRLKEAQSADATQGEWIPCSERLPNESGEYLATIPLDADETYTEVLTFHKGRFYEDDDEWGATYHDDVLAWMPLPTPYKGGDDE